ncbi:MAG: M42 family metallopeptidase [Chloroflexi bacterium]|nr:M42 family metallopeptidase [Chloroflexota bacterium]
MSAKEFLQKISEASGVSGYEHSVRDLVIEQMRPYSDQITVTAMGSIIAKKCGAWASQARSPAPKVLIEGHMDEIGLMVTDIDRGFIRFTNIGGFDARVLPSQEVVVRGNQELRGIIGSRPPHVLSEEERTKVVPLDELFIDVGLPEARVRELVRPGDLVTISRKMMDLKNNIVAGKAFDDRAAVVAISEALRHLATMKHTWDVYAVTNVQEEVGLRGAATSTYAVAPDIAIALDVSHADQPNTTDVNAVPLDSGMGIALGPNIHPMIHNKLVEVAQENEIPYRVTAYAGATGTDAWAIQVVRDGIPTGLIDIPLRYMHTSVETLSLSDLERIGRLLALFCASLDDSFLRQLKAQGEDTETEPADKPRRAGTKRIRRSRRK